MHKTTEPTSAKPVIRIGAGITAATLSLGALTIAPAHAHDTLINANPEEGEVLDEAPGEVVLEFSGSELTTGAGITNEILVLDSDDYDWASEEPAEVEGSTMSTDIPQQLPDGEYEVHYRVVYSDGHDEELSYSFEVDAAEDDEAELAHPEDLEGEENGTTSAPTEFSTPEADSTAPVPDEGEENGATLAEADDQDQAEEDNGGWSGILTWSLLALGILALAGAVGYAAKRRNSAQQD